MHQAPLPVHPSWREPLAPVEARIHAMGDFLREEQRAGRGYLPRGEHILRAFEAPFDEVKVLVVGQDPYPTPGHPIGWSFAVHRDVRPLPRSLANIYRELSDDLQIPAATHGDLSAWVDQGVMLLNRVLTVCPGKAASHRGQGWEEVTQCAIEALAARQRPLVAVLWGKDAQTARSCLGPTPVVASAHPSPLSAHRGFFGSKPFSQVNALLDQQGASPIDWRLQG